MTSSIRLLQHHTELLRASDSHTPREPEPEDPHERAEPLGALKRGELVLARGVSNLELSSTRSDQLFTAAFEGTAPSISNEKGVLSVKSWRGQGVIKLNERIPWLLTITGGLSSSHADLRSIDLEGIELRGGVSDTKLELGAPKGTLAIQIRGGAHRLAVIRPAGVAVRARVGHGATKLTLDTLHLGAVGGEMRWESPDYTQAKQRVDIDVSGGANELTVAFAHEPTETEHTSKTYSDEVRAPKRRGRG
ncbi:MAG: hypothetical protein U0165_18675 [Polyangiaceae bacterium]